MYACDACGEEFETLSALRIEHEPCPVAEEQRRYDEAVERLADERGLEIGDRCRVVATGEEAEIVDIEPGEGDAEPEVVWVPAGEDDPEEGRTATFDEVV
ncbi:hypothetical protein [Natronomonas marina]|jgi:hypothetical protein|uniref:hypothetical protein n=1 Tax=Natronomonas marina TaxID=2961939 RepID=UPI0020CA1F94|nr:hypothetical protein [Natronomonas marina]